MPAAVLPRFDLDRLRNAVEDLDLEGIDLDGARRDLARLRSAVEDVELPHFELPDLPDLESILGRSRRGSAMPSGSLIVGGLALLGGVALGGAMAFFLHPAKGPKRRKQLRKRLGRIKRRVLGVLG